MVLRNQQRELTELRSQIETMQGSVLSQVERVLANHQEQERIPLPRRAASPVLSRSVPFVNLDFEVLRGQTGENSDGKPESSAAAPGAAEPAAEPDPDLGAVQPGGQAAPRGNEENGAAK